MKELDTRGTSWIPLIPNILTFLRLGLIPFFVVLLINPTDMMRYSAAGIFIIAALTDLLDGWIARRYGSVSNFGKLLDPLADKILVTAALVMLVAQRSDLTGEPWIPGWIVVLLLAREIWVTGLRGLAATEGLVMSAGDSGKVKSGLQMVAIVLLLIREPYIVIGDRPITAGLAGMNLLIVSIAFSYWGAIEYTREVLFPGARK